MYYFESIMILLITKMFPFLRACKYFPKMARFNDEQQEILYKFRRTNLAGDPKILVT